ncbi:FecR family protein [Parapedobacter koreensis]|uniref:FecR family protein n=1 Tax=Parapedobacter koreensis TaxID=332977 RepID=A0A1H7RQB2_9SPHI|nr:FecR domain-containing protein [Parapedobacter koreensis]SEL62426.1 FecR family protein [Parapedobacter koreensis]
MAKHVNSAFLKALIQRYQRRQATRGERFIVERWYAWFDQQQADTPAWLNDDEDVKRFEERLIAITSTRNRPARTGRWRIWLGAAATLLVGLCGWWVLEGRLDNQLRQPGRAGTVAEHVTAPGQRKLIRLADGSEVWLGSASRLRYRQDFRGPQREVDVEGQAFFAVSPDPQRPFVVHMDDCTVQVLGTSFDVRNYRDDEHRMITVAEGRVSVRTPVDRIEISKRQQVSVAAKTGSIQVMDQLDESVLTWKEGILVIREQPLPEIVKQLERWYAVSFRIDTPGLKNKRLSLRVRNESLHEVLTVLAVAGGFEFSISGEQVTLY